MAGNEIWENIEGYEGLYQVSSHGRVKSLGRVCRAKNGSSQKKRKMILSQETSIWGYQRVSLYDKSGKARRHAVHRLVANAFIPNPKNKEEINHKNENKADNRVSNLEWVTPKENCNHGTRNERLKKVLINSHGSRVRQLTLSGDVVGEFISRMDAQRSTGIDAGHIGSVCSGKRKTAGGYIWEDVS